MNILGIPYENIIAINISAREIHRQIANMENGNDTSS